MIPLTRVLAIPSVLLAAGGAMAFSSPAASASTSAVKPVCTMQTSPVAGGAYTVENDEWGSSAPECVTTDGTAGFTVAKSSIANVTDGAPGGYPAIYKGCHWGACTSRSGFPIKVSDIAAGTVTTNWSTTQPGGDNDYDVAYDIWFNQTPTTSGQPNGTELMIWLNHNGHVQPFGSKVASDVSLGGRSYDVWYGQQGWNTVSYTMNSGATSVRNLDLKPLVADLVKRGYLKSSWYLIDVEAGFELWQGGAGLATKSFSVNVAGGGASSPSPTRSAPSRAATATRPARSTPSPAPPPRTTPTRPARSPAPTPTPALASTTGISLQAVSPNPTTPGTLTNATVEFTNAGSTTASNETLVTDVRNSAGAIVGSQSWTGQNLAPHQALSETYTWRAAPAPGSYTVEGLVKDASGKTIGHAQAGTVTVK
jgi:Glycosyl hydrolase family 12